MTTGAEYPHMRLVSGYRDDDALRTSFFDLTQRVFGLSFTEWHAAGCWDSSYTCFSLAVGDRVVANVSATTFDLVVAGDPSRAVQLGTVEVDEDFRGMGLGRLLMEHVTQRYDDETDFQFLYAEHNVAGFYRKLGFSPYPEARFTAPVQSGPLSPMVRLDASRAADRSILATLAGRRLPVSRLLGVRDGRAVLMWHAFYGLQGCLHYFPERGAVLIARQEADVLRVYDLITTEPVDMMRFANDRQFPRITTLELHFSPDQSGVVAEPTWSPDDDAMFVRGTFPLVSEAFCLPPTAHT